MTNQEMLERAERVAQSLLYSPNYVALSRLLKIGMAAVEAKDLIEEGAECLPDADGYNAPLWRLHSTLNDSEEGDG